MIVKVGGVGDGNEISIVALQKIVTKNYRARFWNKA